MSGLYASGRIVDLILALVALEALALAAWGRRGGRGPDLVTVALALLPGVLLLAALRGALIGAAWTSIAPWLGAAGLAHVADLRRRLGRR